jgi:hypothetical protein
MLVLMGKRRWKRGQGQRRADNGACDKGGLSTHDATDQGD